MPADAKTPEGFSLKRWSRRKLDASREAAEVDAHTPTPNIGTPTGNVPSAQPAAAPAVPTAEYVPVLPPVESLTADSDFTAYLQPTVDEAVKRLALKKMFTDPRFNVMDGLDVYIDDYTKTVPIPTETLEQLMANFTFNPPPVPAEKSPRQAAEPSLDSAPPATDQGNASPAAADARAQLPAERSDESGTPDLQDPTPSR